MRVPRVALLCAIFLIATSCGDDSGVDPSITATTTATLSTSTVAVATTTAPTTGDTLGADPPDEATGTLADLMGHLFEDPFEDSGFVAMDWIDERGVLVSGESIMGSGPGLDLLGLGPLLPPPTLTGVGTNQVLVQAWVDNYTGDIVPQAIVLYTRDPSGWVATAVIDSIAVEEALLLTTDYDAVAPPGPVAVQTTVSVFDWAARVFRAGVSVFEYSGGFELTYEGEIECSIADPLECTTLSDDGVLRPGDEGEAVEALQNDLSTLGYSTGAIDGKYGSQTSGAVSALQTDFLLTVDGRAGPQTLGLIADLVAGVSDLILASKEGIGTVAFGAPADPAYGDLFDILGPPDSTTGWYVDACDGADWLQATWAGFTAIFTDRDGFRQLDGWEVNDLSNLPVGVLIAGGIEPNWTWADFEAVGAEFDPTYGAFFYLTDLAYNNGRFVNPPTNPPAPDAAVRSFGTGTGAFVSC